MAPPIEVIVVEKVDTLSFLMNFLFTSFEFRTIGMGVITKIPEPYTTTPIEGQSILLRTGS